jgi:hypothetical protein
MKILAALGISAVLLTGCTTMNVYEARWIDLPGGGKVLCVNNNDAGISCDWGRVQGK